MNEKKKILILAGASVHKKVVQTAKKMGIYTIVTDYLPFEKSPAKQISDEYWDIDINDIENIVKKCRECKINGILNYCIDPAQIPYVKICKELNLPCYATQEQMDIMTNKVKFRKFALENKLKVIPSYSLERALTDEHIYPLLVKPACSRGSRGQMVCYSPHDIEMGVTNAIQESGNNEYIIEKYMENAQDIALSYLVINGTPYLMKFADRYVGLKEHFTDRQQACAILPSHLIDKYKSDIEYNVINFIKRLGVKFGPIFLQAFILNGEIYVYDPGIRFPGSDYDLALIKATYFNPIKILINYALGENVKNEYPAYILDDMCYYNNKCCILLSIICREGKIKKIEGLEIIEDDSRVLSVDKRYRVGDRILQTGDIKQRVFEIVALLTSKNYINNFLSFVYDNLKIYDEHYEDMIIDKIGIEVNIKE